MGRRVVARLRGLAGHLPSLHRDEAEKAILLVSHFDAGLREEELHDCVVCGGSLDGGSGREAIDGSKDVGSTLVVGMVDNLKAFFASPLPA